MLFSNCFKSIYFIYKFSFCVLVILTCFSIAIYLKSWVVEVPLVESSIIQELLNKTRSKIRRQVAWYNYSLIGAHRLEDLVIESGGKPLQSIIISSWRSGSTYLGQILNAVPGTYYHFEPLRFYGTRKIRAYSGASLTWTIIKSLINCDYENVENYLNYAHAMGRNFHGHNTRLWDICRRNRLLCADISFLSHFCKLFPFQAMTMVRLRLGIMRKILGDKE